MGAPGTFTNPIKRNGPDPWLQYYNGYYYLATTTWNSTITMRRSRTLAGLSSAADTVVFNLSGRPNGCCNMWAPEFHLLNGRWYLYYVAGQNVPDYNPTQRLHVLESAGTDPMGPYTFKADLGNTWELDPSILQHNGKLYLMGSAIDGTQSLTITPLSNPYTISGARRTISQPTLAWERQTAPVNEGAEPLYRNGRIMIVYSASACWGPDYKLGLLTLTGVRPTQPVALDQVPEPGVPAQRRQRRLRPRPQRVLQVTRRHRGLDRLPRQRQRLGRLRHEPLHPSAEVHLERRRHAQLRHAGTTRHPARRPFRRAHQLTGRNFGSDRAVQLDVPTVRLPDHHASLDAVRNDLCVVVLQPEAEAAGDHQRDGRAQDDEHLEEAQQRVDREVEQHCHRVRTGCGPEHAVEGDARDPDARSGRVVAGPLEEVVVSTVAGQPLLDERVAGDEREEQRADRDRQQDGEAESSCPG